MTDSYTGWTVASRYHTGDRYFHRVQGLNLSMGQAVDLAIYLDNHKGDRWRAVTTTAKQWFVRKSNRTIARIWIRENGVLPFELRKDRVEAKPVIDHNMLNVFLNGEHIGETDFSYTPSFNPKSGLQRKRWCAIGMWANGAVTKPLGAFATKEEAVEAVVNCYKDKDKEESELLK